MKNTVNTYKLTESMKNSNASIRKAEKQQGRKTANKQYYHQLSNGKELYITSEELYQKASEALWNDDKSLYFELLHGAIYQRAVKYLLDIGIISLLDYNNSNVDDYKQVSNLKLWEQLQNFLPFKNKEGEVFTMAELDERKLFCILASRCSRSIQTYIEKNASVTSQRANKYWHELEEKRDELTSFAFRKESKKLYEEAEKEDSIEKSDKDYYAIMLNGIIIKEVLTSAQYNAIVRILERGNSNNENKKYLKTIGAKLTENGISLASLSEVIRNDML